MKTKVYSWKANLNDIKQSYMDIEQIPDTKIYKTLELDEYKNYKIFAEYKGIIFEIGNVTQHRFDDLIHNKSFKIDINDEVIKERYLSGYPNYLVLKVIELSGEDLKPYLEKRKNQLDERKKAEEDRERKKAEEDRERIEREKKDQLLKFEKLKTDLKNNQLVYMKDIIEYAKFHDIKIHPRTLGSIYEQPDYMKISQNRIADYFKKRQSVLNSYWKVVETVMETF